MAGALTVRELITKYRFDADKRPIAAFNRAIDGVKRAAKIATGAVVAMAAGTAKLLTSVADSSDKIAKTSRRIGVSTAFLQEMGHAAKLSGASVDDVTVGLRRLSAAAYEAGRGSKEQRDAFRALGVSV